MHVVKPPPPVTAHVPEDVPIAEPTVTTNESIGKGEDDAVDGTTRVDVRHFWSCISRHGWCMTGIDLRRPASLKWRGESHEVREARQGIADHLGPWFQHMA
ncbi:hypothetical protein C4D60_Mb02t03560 [Musa balbisiana]|uniref:Uncharacterized protein n=1 Tax=Musa balbisiana TaxID=52838 RepID=A0A4V4H2E7_MUSBA|nr:hypothetical protein C4D60_Mb02t03560 [Musa balbisiana]